MCTAWKYKMVALKDEGNRKMQTTCTLLSLNGSQIKMYVILFKYTTMHYICYFFSVTLCRATVSHTHKHTYTQSLVIRVSKLWKLEQYRVRQREDVESCTFVMSSWYV